MEPPIYFFFHIAKNGGTTIIEHIKRSLPKNEYLELSGNLNKKKSEKIVKDLNLRQKRKLKVVFGHAVSADLDKYFDREARFICVVRNPVDRFSSLYNYWRTLYERDNNKNKKDYKNALLVRNRVPDFNEWLKVKFKNKRADHTLRRMTRFLEDFGYKNLEKIFFVGTMNTFEEDSLFIYHLLGINKFFMKKNVSVKFHKPTNKDKKKIKSIAKKSFVIYKDGVKLNKEFKKTHKDFYKIVRFMKIKKLVLMPFTQLLLAPDQIKENLANLLHE